MDLVQRVGSLRHDLKDLEDAQDNLLEANAEVGIDKGDTDTADKPEAEARRSPMTISRSTDRSADPEAADVADRRARPSAPKPPTTLDGPALPAEPRAETTVGRSRISRRRRSPSRSA